MASSSRPASPTAGLSSLLTSAEREVLEATTGSSLAKATQQEVQKLVKQARDLRDKWRGLHESQSRSNKRTKDRGAANARSREKHELFHGAVGRLEARLAEFGGAVAAAVKGVTSRAAAKASVQAKRRSQRTGLRTELRRAAAALSKKPVAAKPTAAKSAAAKSTAAKPAEKGAKPVPVATPAAPAVAVGGKTSATRKPLKAASKKSLAAEGTGQHVGFDVAKQRKARAAATVARLKFDGQVTRRGGHMLARGRRSQARRDSRTR